MSSAEVDERLEQYNKICKAVATLQTASATTSIHVNGLCKGVSEMARAYETIAGQLDDSDVLMSDVQKLVEFSNQIGNMGNDLNQRLRKMKGSTPQQMEKNKQALTVFRRAADSEKKRHKAMNDLQRLKRTGSSTLRSIDSAAKAYERAAEQSRKDNSEADKADLDACTSARSLLFETSFNDLTEGLQHFFTSSAVSLTSVQRIEKPHVSFDEGQVALKDLRVFATTFNAGDRLPDSHDMKLWLPLELLRQHDVVALALQEAAVERGQDDDRDEAAVEDMDGRRDRMELAILKHFEGTDFRQLPQTKTGSVYKGQRLVVEPSIRLHVFVSASIFDRVHSVQMEAVNTGYTGVFNKGALVCCLNIDTTSLAFVSSHLPAHEGAAKCLKRNADVIKIMKAAKKSIRCPKLGLEATAQHVFWLGDLNYRVRPLRDGIPMDAFRKEVHAAIARKDYAAVLRGDELKLEQRAGRVFGGYQTPDPTFAPTFKVQRGSTGAVYNPKRTPSYTDRILVHSLPGATISNDSYEAVFDVKSSDHKPVRGTFTISRRKAQARLLTFVPEERRPKVLFRSIAIDGLRGCAAQQVQVEVHVDPWWAHGYHGYTRCVSETKSTAESISFDFRQGLGQVVSSVNPEADFRIGNLEGTHLFLCLVDPSKRTPSESGIGHAIVSMDTAWEQQRSAGGSRPLNLPLVSDGVVIGRMRIDLEIVRWGDETSGAERRLSVLNTLLTESPNDESIKNDIKDLMMETVKRSPSMESASDPTDQSFLWGDDIEEHRDPAGQIYYYNKVTGNTGWSPGEAYGVGAATGAESIQTHVDAQGQTYYYDPMTGKHGWDLSELGHDVPAPSAPPLEQEEAFPMPNAMPGGLMSHTGGNTATRPFVAQQQSPAIDTSHVPMVPPTSRDSGLLPTASSIAPPLRSPMAGSQGQMLFRASVISQMNHRDELPTAGGGGGPLVSPMAGSQGHIDGQMLFRASVTSQMDHHAGLTTGGGGGPLVSPMAGGQGHVNGQMLFRASVTSDIPSPTVLPPRRPDEKPARGEMRKLKIVVVGDNIRVESDAGSRALKTLVLFTYLNNKHPRGYMPSVFDTAIKSVVVDGLPFELSLNDTAGQEEHRTLRKLSYPDTDVFIVLFSLTDPSSFSSVDASWSTEIQHEMPNTPFLLVGEGLDRRANPEVLRALQRQGKRPISTAQGESKAKAIGAYRYLECSALTQEGLEEVFDEAARCCASNHGGSAARGSGSEGSSKRSSSGGWLSSPRWGSRRGSK